ncbi:hypothetical protein ABVK25_001486 [Lepraria finkii]|uniref:Prolactin receptor n=1 Tax=Lepraria finkii TaxID=1340010 RepID=A0ABR4BJ76_9LECA
MSRQAPLSSRNTNTNTDKSWQAPLLAHLSDPSSEDVSASPKRKDFQHERKGSDP